MDVKMWEQEVVIPTYSVGEPDKNPMFLEKRVYQGSCGKVYPYPVIDKIYDEKVDKTYNAVFLENDYIQVMILPELGGRIQRAYDKTNHYDFVYYNEVIKPALVGLAGPWISGGIEFNWPQHHRPSTFSPTDYYLEEHEDGSKTVYISEIDPMYGTKGMAAFTLYKDKAYIEIKGQLYNRTPLPQTFLWWANPAVAVNDYTQSVFPPDVHAVMDHGKRDVSTFPIATGTYYKVDYSAGVDISRYKNIPVPTSYMAYHSDYDFVGGYDHNLHAGILHIADHHISPGKKQWTWGNGDFGQAWDRNLTDENGPYIELMTGMFTDNQPDFTWLMPFEEKTFTQYFMPYKTIGMVKCANINVAVNLEQKDKKACVKVYATSKFEKATILLKSRDKVYIEELFDVSPNNIFEKEILTDVSLYELTLTVYDCNKNILIEYTPKQNDTDTIPEPAKAAKEPSEIPTNEELYMTALHLEQYRHATYEPEDYYLEGLKRDPYDIRINNAYGTLLLRRGLFSESETYFRTAISRLISRNPNPYDSEAYYNLGLSLFYQNKYQESFDNFYKATWSSHQQENAFYYLAAIECIKNNFSHALELVERAIVKNYHNMKARNLKAVILRKLGKLDKAEIWTTQSIDIDKLDFAARYELYKIAQQTNAPYTEALLNEFKQLSRNTINSHIELSIDYSEAGFFHESLEILCMCESSAMIHYYKGYYSLALNKKERAIEFFSAAAKADSLYCFPNKLTDILVLEAAIAINPTDAKAYYYLGNLWYDKKQYTKAIHYWEKSSELDNSFPTVLRNLSLAYYNKLNDSTNALTYLERAFSIDTSDARIFLELDQLYKKLCVPHTTRLSNYESYQQTFIKRDDLYTEYVTLHNALGQHEKAYELITQRKFHPWEGGEGKISSQYVLALTEMAKECISRGDYNKAIEYLNMSKVYPHNLGEGKLVGATDNNIHYYLGICYEKLNDSSNALKYFTQASTGADEIGSMMYYNDQPADMILYQALANIKLGQTVKAQEQLNMLITYGNKHIDDTIKIDYFAVSLPDFLIFDEDLNKKNKMHCHYLIGLGNLGLGNTQEAKESFDTVLNMDNNHIGALIHKKLV
jgi:tetratricopeptide (TPR) repeat protein